MLWSGGNGHAAPDPGSAGPATCGESRQRRNYRLAVSWVSSPRNSDIVTGTGPAVRPAAAPGPRPHGRRDPWLRSGSEDGMTLPLAGRPGHGRTAFVRLQPARIVDGRFEGGYTRLFELICPGCGDHPYLDYEEIPPRLRWLRGPRSLAAALAVYNKHLGSSATNGDSAGSLGPGLRGGAAQLHQLRDRRGLVAGQPGCLRFGARLVFHRDHAAALASSARVSRTSVHLTWVGLHLKAR